MARKRMIDPSFWDDPDVGCLEPAERLLVLAFISLADDYGHLSADPRFLCKQVFGYGGATPEQVGEMRDRVVANCRNIILYEVGGQPYIELVKWTQYQDLRYVSKPQYPSPNGQAPTPPPQDAGDNAGKGENLASTTQETRKNHARTADQVRLDKVSLGNLQDRSTPPPPLSSASPSREPGDATLPADEEVVVVAADAEDETDPPLDLEYYRSFATRTDVAPSPIADPVPVPETLAPAVAWQALTTSNALCRTAKRSHCKPISLEGGVLTVEVHDSEMLGRLQNAPPPYGGDIQRVVFVAPASERAA